MGARKMTKGPIDHVFILFRLPSSEGLLHVSVLPHPPPPPQPPPPQLPSLAFFFFQGCFVATPPPLFALNSASSTATSSSAQAIPGEGAPPPALPPCAPGPRWTRLSAFTFTSKIIFGDIFFRKLLRLCVTALSLTPPSPCTATPGGPKGDHVHGRFHLERRRRQLARVRRGRACLRRSPPRPAPPQGRRRRFIGVKEVPR